VHHTSAQGIDNNLNINSAHNLTTKGLTKQDLTHPWSTLVLKIYTVQDTTPRGPAKHKYHIPTQNNISLKNLKQDITVLNSTPLHPAAGMNIRRQDCAKPCTAQPYRSLHHLTLTE